MEHLLTVYGGLELCKEGSELLAGGQQEEGMRRLSGGISMIKGAYEDQYGHRMPEPRSVRKVMTGTLRRLDELLLAVSKGDAAGIRAAKEEVDKRLSPLMWVIYPVAFQRDS